MLVSVIIPTYNRAHLIGDTIKSVLNQTNSDFEVVIVDDGSTDNTEEVVKQYLSDTVSYYKVPNGERGAARNFGTQKAKGKYVNWFDSDDQMLPNHVETLAKNLEKLNYPDIITTHFNVKYNTENYIQEKPFLIESQSSFKRALVKGNCLSCNSVVVNREVALNNPFSELRELSASEDYELWLRLASKIEFHNLPAVTTTIIQHDERSVLTMSDPIKLEKRFLTFLKLTQENEHLKNYLGADFLYFVMRNYLVLAVDLAYHKHKKMAWTYLKLAFKVHKGALRQRVFWATVKHILLP